MNHRFQNFEGRAPPIEYGNGGRRWTSDSRHPLPRLLGRGKLYYILRVFLVNIYTVGRYSDVTKAHATHPATLTRFGLRQGDTQCLETPNARGSICHWKAGVEQTSTHNPPRLVTSRILPFQAHATASVQPFGARLHSRSSLVPHPRQDYEQNQRETR